MTASAWTNKGKFELASAGTTGRTFRILLVGTEPTSVGAVADFNVTADIVANELSGTGYARKTLANVTVTEDDTNDWAKISADNPSVYTAMSAGTIKGAWIFRRIGGSDADSSDLLWCWLDCTDLVTNGGDVTIAFGANGIATLA